MIVVGRSVALVAGSTTAVWTDGTYDVSFYVLNYEDSKISMNLNGVDGCLTIKQKEGSF